MAHGNIYAAERVDAALSNYFRVGNLGALRELALLWVADKVDDELNDYRHRHGIERPWETRERVVVALTGAPGGDQLVRRAARLAARSKAELLAVHVQRDDGRRGPPTELLERHRELVEELGGRFMEVIGADVAHALLDVAKAENATQIVLGASRRSRLAEMMSGSVIERVIRDSGAIDVHVVSTAAGDAELLLPRPKRSALPVRRQIAGWGLAASAPLLLSVALVPLRDDLQLASILLLFLGLAVAIAAVGGVGPGALSAVSGFLLVNWFFTPPLHTFTVGEAENLLALVVFLAVAATVSAYVALASRRAAEANRARAEATTLARLSGGDDADPERLAHLLEHLREAFSVRGAAVLGRDEVDDDWVPLRSRATARRCARRMPTPASTSPSTTVRLCSSSPGGSRRATAVCSPPSPTASATCSTSGAWRRRWRRRRSFSGGTSCGRPSSPP